MKSVYEVVCRSTLMAAVLCSGVGTASSAADSALVGKRPGKFSMASQIRDLEPVPVVPSPGPIRKAKVKVGISKMSYSKNPLTGEFEYSHVEVCEVTGEFGVYDMRGIDGPGLIIEHSFVSCPAQLEGVGKIEVMVSGSVRITDGSVAPYTGELKWFDAHQYLWREDDSDWVPDAKHVLANTVATRDLSLSSLLVTLSDNNIMDPLQPKEAFYSWVEFVDDQGVKK